MTLTGRRPLLVLALAAVLVLGACRGSGKKKAATTTSSSSKSSSSTDDKSDLPTVAPVVAISGAGLTFVMDASTTNLDFAVADEAATKTALEAALGTPKAADIGRPCDDGSSRTFDSVRYEGLVVFFLNGKLSGWSSESQEFTTLDGIGPGSTLSDLRAAYGEVRVFDSSLGTEFSLGPMGGGGVLDGTSDHATVTTIFNGQLCILR